MAAIKLPKIKINWDHVLEDSLAIVLGLGALGAGAYIIYGIVQRLGQFSYLGLTAAQVQAVMNRIDQIYPILSRVQGGDATHTWYRGIYGGGIPIYYRYDIYSDGRADLQLYPLLWSELWSTSPDFLNTSGTPVHP